MTLVFAFIVPLVVGMRLLVEMAQAAGRPLRKTTALLIPLVGVVAIPSILQFVFPGLLHALRRDADLILHHWQFWRMLTSLLVQDGGVAGTIFNLLFLLWFAVIAAWLFGDRNLLLLFLGGALIGELAGLRWQPIGAGNSVGNLGVAGGILAFALLSGRPVNRLLAFVGVALDILLLAQRNIHGPALLAGVGFGFVLLSGRSG